MAVTSENKGLKDSFQKANVFDLSVRSELSERMENYEERRLDQFVADELLSGKGDASILQMGRRVIASAAGAIQELNLKSEERQKQADADAHFRNILSIIQDGRVNSHIADEVFDNKTDVQIVTIIRDIEATTGDSFEVYAKGILGEKVPERLPYETTADHQRRVLKAITSEILDPETGEVKPQYADDPVAQIIQGDDKYKQIINDIEAVNARVEREGVTAEVQNHIDEVTMNDYHSAHLHGKELDSAELSKVSRDNQDAKTDITTNSVELASENSNFFDALGMEDTKIANASEAGKVEFNKISQEISSASVTPAVDMDFNIKPT